MHWIHPGDHGTEPLQELGPLLHDGEVSAPVGVEHVVKAHAVEGSGQLAGLTGAGGQAEALANAHADRRSGLHHHMLVGVVDGLNDPILVGRLPQGAHRADNDALAAEGAGRVAHGQAEGGGDHRLEPTVFRREDRGGLDILTHADTAAAEDALVGVPGDGLADVDGLQVPLPFVGRVLHPQFPAQGLELAVLVPSAGEALLVVVGQEQLVHGLPGFLHSGVVGLDDHAILGLHHTGGLEIFGRGADLFYHADTAGAVLVDAFQVAQFGDVDAVALSGLQNGAAGRGGTHFSVDGEFDICHVSYLLSQRRQRLASARASSSCIPRFRSQKLPTAFSASICLVRKRSWGTISPSMW